MTPLRLLSCSLLLLASAGSARAGRYAYVPVADGGGVTIRKIDMISQSVVATGWIGASPGASMSVAVPPDETSVYLSLGGPGLLFKIDATSLQPMQYAPIGCQPAAVAAAPDHSAVFVACSTGEVKRFKSNLQPTGGIGPFGGALTSISVNSAAGAHRGRIYVTGPGVIHVLSLTPMAFQKTIPLASCSLEFPALWQQTTAYVLCRKPEAQEGWVYRIDACAGDRIVTTGGWPKRLTHVVAPTAMGLTPSKRYLFITGEQGRIEELSTATAGTVLTGAAPDGWPRNAIGIGDAYEAVPDMATRVAAPKLYTVGQFTATLQIILGPDLPFTGEPRVAGLLTSPGLPGDICPLCQP